MPTRAVRKDGDARARFSRGTADDEPLLLYVMKQVELAVRAELDEIARPAGSSAAELIRRPDDRRWMLFDSLLLFALRFWAAVRAATFVLMRVDKDVPSMKRAAVSAERRKC